MFHQSIYPPVLCLTNWREGSWPAKQELPLDDLNANNLSFSFLPLSFILSHKFCQSSKMLLPEASRRTRRFDWLDPTQVKGWLDATCWGKHQPLFTFVLFQRFEFHMWMWGASCNYNKWVCTLIFRCKLLLPHFFGIYWTNKLKDTFDNLLIWLCLVFVLLWDKFLTKTQVQGNLEKSPLFTNSNWILKNPVFHWQDLVLKTSVLKSIYLLSRLASSCAQDNNSFFTLVQFGIFNSPHIHVVGKKSAKLERTRNRPRENVQTLDRKVPEENWILWELNPQPLVSVATALTTASIWVFFHL